MKTQLLTCLLLIASFICPAQCTDIIANFTDSVSGNHVYFTDQTVANNGWLIEKRYWAYGDSTYDSIVLNPVHIYPRAGAFQACLTIQGKLPGDTSTALYCSQTVCKQVFPLTSVIEATEQEEWRIYPNPSNGYLRLKQGEGRLESISLYSLSGQLLLKTHEPLPVIDLPTANGAQAFWVRIETDRGVISKLILSSN